MTPSELKNNYNNIQKGYFFERKTMRFFGDTMKNYRCRQAIHKGVDVWELWRKNPVKKGVQNSAYFDLKTFKIVR
ncbi:MAG: hypothetical protein GY710_06190 [Desulfobacteraceae bacterium]|nr:hypothetical protein [Desulfobacteraceae bacterium]